MFNIEFLKKTQRKLIVLIVVCAAIGALLLFNKSVPQSPIASNNPEIQQPGVVRFPNGDGRLSLIKTQVLPLTPVPIADELSARIQYDDDVTTRITTSFSGRIVELRAAPGDKVKAGQILAIIDSPDVGLAIADVNKARADEKRKALALKRAKELVPGEAISKRDWESVQAEYTQARAETARAEQRLKNLNPHDLAIDGQRVILASPIQGTVTERSATPAMEVSPNATTPLFVVTNLDRLWLSIDLPETLLGKVSINSKVSITSEAYPGETFNASIIQLGQVINPNSRRASVLARVDNSTGKLLPEMFVRASILQSQGKGVRVPNQSLIIRGVYAHVFIEKSPGAFQLQRVSLVKRGMNFSYVGEGLSGEDKVVVKGALLLDAELSARAGDK